MPQRAANTPPAITTEQMRRVDQLMVEAYGISLLQMMENAGRDLAVLARRLLGGRVSDRRVVILCGAGNNGGGGMVAARHLHNWGARAQVQLAAEPEHLKDVPAHQWRTVRALGLEATAPPDLAQADLIVDALIGYGLTGDPRPEVAGWIERANTAERPILALDTPSGLDVTTGVPGQPAVRATATLTLALPKVGLLAETARPFVGQLYLADIGVPPELYQQMGLTVPDLFAAGEIVALQSGHA
jgi:NAD(P)H-hydrate epimerase